MEVILLGTHSKFMELFFSILKVSKYIVIEGVKYIVIEGKCIVCLWFSIVSVSC